MYSWAKHFIPCCSSSFNWQTLVVLWRTGAQPRWGIYTSLESEKRHLPVGVAWQDHSTLTWWSDLSCSAVWGDYNDQQPVGFTLARVLLLRELLYRTGGLHQRWSYGKCARPIEGPHNLNSCWRCFTQPFLFQRNTQDSESLWLEFLPQNPN